MSDDTQNAEQNDAPIEGVKVEPDEIEIDPTALLPIPPIRVIEDSPVKSCVVEVTPDWARAMLTHRLHQRPASQVYVDKYARDMTAGNWLLTGEPIILSGVEKVAIRGGFMEISDADGSWSKIESEDMQHRLLACVESGVPFQTLMVWGVDGPSIRKLLDQGKSRSLTDVLNYADDLGIERDVVTLKALKDASVKYMGVLQAWDGEKAKTPTSTEMIDWLHDNIDLIESVQLAMTVKEQLPSKATPALMAMTGYHIRTSYDSEAQEEFINGFASMAELPEGHPYLVARVVLEQFVTKRWDVKPTWKDSFRVLMNAAKLAQDQVWPVRETQVKKKPKKGSLPEPMWSALKAVA